MTHISTKDNSEEFVLEVVGHTGYGNVGTDILCAAVSILVQTLAAMLDEESKVDVKEGYALVCGKGKKAMDAYEFTMTGLNMLQINFPRHIVIEGYPKL